MNSIYVIVGCWEVFDDDTFANTALIFDRRGEIVGKYRKTHPAIDHYEGNPPWARPPANKTRDWMIRNDPEWIMEAGTDLPVYEFDFGKVAVMTCYDGWFPEPARVLSLKGAELLVWMNGRGGSVEDFIVKSTMFQSHVAMIATNQAYGSGTMIGDNAKRPTGIIARCPDKQESYISATINLKQIRKVRADSRNFRQRRPDLYGKLVEPMETQERAVAAADEADPVFSGPQPGENLPALKVALVYGQDEGTTVDLVERAAGRPTLLVIVNGSNRPAARLTRTLMNFAEMHQERLFAGVVYLDNDLPAAVERLKQAVSWWQVGPPVGVSIDSAEGPGSYGLNRNVNVTVLVAKEGRVVRNDALVQPSEIDAPKILKDVVALAGGRVPTMAEVMFLSAPTRKLPSVSWRQAPSDVKLRELICNALAAEDNQTARCAVAAVEKYVADHHDRQVALGDTAAILLEGRTRVRGQPIVKHLPNWRTKYDSRPNKKKKAGTSFPQFRPQRVFA